MELDESGFPQPTGELEELEADSLVLALGQEADLSLLDGVAGHRGRGRRGAGGPEHDDRPSRHLRGRRHGARRAHRHRGRGPRQAGRPPHRRLAARRRTTRPAPKPELASFEKLNTWYYADAPKTVQPQLELARRSPPSTRWCGGLDESNALFEARRCLSCGNCFACDNCYGVCPDNAVIKLEPGGAYAYDYDLDYCKGCGCCANECPSGAIQMVPGDV